MKQVMVDIETLGTDPGSVILSIGAVRFNKQKTGQTFYRAINVLDSILAGLKVDEKTAAWWRTQPDEAVGPLYPQRPLKTTLAEFSSFVTGHDTIWAKGPDFDLVLLDHAYRAAGLRVPWSFRNARDVRTILALSPKRKPVVDLGTKHMALDDAVYQARQVISAYRKLGK